MLNDADRVTDADRPSHLEPSRGPADRGAVAVLFRNRFGHWRGGWRLLLYLAALLLLGWALSSLLSAIGLGGDGGLESWAMVTRSLRRTLVLIVAALLLLRWVDERPVAALGLGFEPGWRSELAIGAAIGCGLVSAVVLVLVVTGRVTLVATSGGAIAALPRLLLVFVFAGAAEELLFRGYPLQVLGEASRPWVAATALCLLFAAVHLDNPDVSRLGALNIFIIGLLLAVGYFQTRRLWLPIGCHAAFNLSQSWLWGFDVSGFHLDSTLFTALPTGPDMVTGGGFGIEGSVVTTIVVGAVLVWAVVVRAAAPATEVVALWRRYPAGFGQPPANPIPRLDGIGGDRSSDAGRASSPDEALPGTGVDAAERAVDRSQEHPELLLPVTVEGEETGSEAVDAVPIGGRESHDPEQTVDRFVGQSEGES